MKVMVRRVIMGCRNSKGDKRLNSELDFSIPILIEVGYRFQFFFKNSTIIVHVLLPKQRNYTKQNASSVDRLKARYGDMKVEQAKNITASNTN